MQVINRTAWALALAMLTVALVATSLPRDARSGPRLALRSATDLIVDSQPMRVEAVEKDYAFSTPASDVYRFEVRKNDFGWDGDKAAHNRRSELVSKGDRYYSGDTLWSAFSFVVGPDHLPFDPEGENPDSSHNIIHQWHSVDTASGRSPVLAIELRDGDFTVSTRSDDDPSRLVTHYSETRPTDGVVHDVVVSGLLGSGGHLNVWLDGKQIVDEDTAIGYYDDDNGLAYPHWGIYQKNVDDPAIVYHANIEWGLEELSGRVTSPPNVIEPPGGWL
ncbi:hypothetical protein NGTWS0302_14560 [Mycolicibacterium cyprinidarum]|uniref:Alginate lyase n=1 Tax=Mycolicibacterium cyprinidarum TaxID=2860311 RepID=A0ABQ4VAB1_9MYCO|nr:hypothetical protein NGTWS1702_38140 [Mycolicibacterium sp. NGTWSNA01]GJF17611.1 hypothetical protein NGTWS0302_14560 [Mycolicibacterium sp. NGTWS0302]